MSQNSAPPSAQEPGHDEGAGADARAMSPASGATTIGASVHGEVWSAASSSVALHDLQELDEDEDRPERAEAEPESRRSPPSCGRGTAAAAGAEPRCEHSHATNEASRMPPAMRLPSTSRLSQPASLPRT